MAETRKIRNRDQRHSEKQKIVKLIEELNHFAKGLFNMKTLDEAKTRLVESLEKLNRQRLLVAPPTDTGKA